LDFWALRVDLSCPDLRVVARFGGLNNRVTSFVRNNGLAAGINASPFDIIAGEGVPVRNIGIVISEGRLISPANSYFDAIVFYNDGTAAIVSQADIDSVQNIKNAIGGLHQVLKDNRLVTRAADSGERHPRSAAGISQDGRYLYLLAIDGRRVGSVGATESETALLLYALGSRDGINFDGGGSSTLALLFPDGMVRPVNTPVNNGIPGRERAVAGCLGIAVIP
jgi:exopolysaccharide biosynthesis protein